MDKIFCIIIDNGEPVVQLLILDDEEAMVSVGVSKLKVNPVLPVPDNLVSVASTDAYYWVYCHDRQLTTLFMSSLKAKSVMVWQAPAAILCNQPLPQNVETYVTPTFILDSTLCSIKWWSPQVLPTGILVHVLRVYYIFPTLCKKIQF